MQVVSRPKIDKKKEKYTLHCAVFSFYSTGNTIIYINSVLEKRSHLVSRDFTMNTHRGFVPYSLKRNKPTVKCWQNAWLQVIKSINNVIVWLSSKYQLTKLFMNDLSAIHWSMVFRSVMESRTARVPLSSARHSTPMAPWHTAYKQPLSASL